MPTVYLNEKEKRLLDLLSDEIWRNMAGGACPPSQFDSWKEAEEALEHLDSKVHRAEK